MNAQTKYPIPTIGSGLTLYSLTNEWLEGRYDLEGIVREVAARGVGPGVEVVGYQSFRSYPDIDDATADWWHGLTSELGLVSTCLSSNVDTALRSDRFLDADEMTELLVRQLHTAKKLGFGIVRIQIGASLEVIRRVAPIAEDLGLRVGMELHAPEGPRTESILRVRDLYAELDSPVLGFIPDFSATMRDIPPMEKRQFVEAGLSEELVDVFVGTWRTAPGTMAERFQAFRTIALEQGASEDAIESTMGALSMHGTQPLESWYDIADQIIHVHGKCYEFDSNGDEPSVDYSGVAKLLVDIGYEGWVSTEWEGHFMAAPDVEAFSQVEAHQALLARSFQEQLDARA
ncbi:sugar phosphate isomerase/epimerase [Microbacterium sp. YMB-B2]|uniref:Sugar phosphate isomerase/epimerase n=1 Tax=Microbacterium tenebrionis TaxID=2830665 RepID=A0A9X1LNC9_9MICO|nr:TIM barrel protein [Microbacterium tenebrionis]MCC2028876.1 sugar phosphate isomerase/epimerase [Microbacterium tenebrionis]